MESGLDQKDSGHLPSLTPQKKAAPFGLSPERGGDTGDVLLSHNL